MKLNRQNLGTGLLIAILATACAPQVKVKGKATVPGAEKTVAADASGTIGQKSANEVLAAQMMKDPDLISFLKNFQTKYNVDCANPRQNQVRAGCSETACGVTLDVTCTSRFSTGTDASVVGDNNLLYRISIPGETDVSKNIAKWSLDQAVVKTLQVKAEDWKALDAAAAGSSENAASPTTSNASSVSQSNTQSDSQS